MKTVQAGIAFLLMVFLLAGNAFAQCTRVPLLEALDAMTSDSEVTVNTVTVSSWGSPNYYYKFTPNGMTPQDGFIIYPGGDVDERASAVLARDIAKAGFLAVIVPMPSCIALLGTGRADTVIDNNPGITTWTIGGHSLGGVAACAYINNGAGKFTNTNKVSGIVLWAAYPGGSIAAKPVKVISLWGTKDALTTEQKINDSKPNLPSDTYYIGLTGANHTQFGWYGETADDYDYLTVGSDGVTVDNPADISREEQDNLVVSYTVNFLDSLTPATLNTPAAVAQVTADDGSVWEKVSLHGFGDINNTDIVALTPYKGNLYALTRNDVSGFELWKTDPAQGWQRIHVQGFTDQNTYYGYLQQYPYATAAKEQYNPNMNIWADMIEFKDRLYVAVSTGYQGSALFGSRGALIWRTDGVAWEPVIGGQAPVAQGTLTDISSCVNNDGSTTAYFTDSTKSWATNSLVGAIIAVGAEFTSFTHGQTGVTVPGKRLFRITENTATRLTVQQDEIGPASTIEYTRCEEYLAGGSDTGRPRNNMPKVVTGAAYTITSGANSQGFGDPWNKSIIDFEILNNELYASIGLNYQQGARVMKTSDGLTWAADSPYSFGNIHGYDWHNGSVIATGSCPDAGYDTAAYRGIPVSSSATKMVKTSVTGSETLLIGGTGTAGCNGRGARIYRRDGSNAWTPIVDVLVDGNITGTNENGFGYDSGGDFFLSAFQAWSWVEYNNQLLVGVAKLEAGGMIYSTPNASELDGAWGFSMGGADRVGDPVTFIADSSPDPTFNGFGDVLNTGVYLHNFNDTLFAGTLVTNQSMYYLNPINGADLWKGSADGGSIAWSRIVGDGFGDNSVLQFQSFADYASNMYMVASTVNSSDFRGQEPANYTGVVVYRLAVDAPECLNNSGCAEGSECVDGECVAITCEDSLSCPEGFGCVDNVCAEDQPPIFISEPLWTSSWMGLSSDPANPHKPQSQHILFWAYNDDRLACRGSVELGWMYRPVELQEGEVVALGDWVVKEPWRYLWFAWIETPGIADIPGPGLFEFKMTATDCLDQETDSEGFWGKRYYFQVD